MLKLGDNDVRGLRVCVARRRARRYGIRVRGDGTVSVTVPSPGGTLRAASQFLEEQWAWIVEARARMLERVAASPKPQPPGRMDVLLLQALLSGLMDKWCALLGETGVTWKTRSMKTRWGVCNYNRRRITFAEMLAGQEVAQVEYVVVHELTHLQAHGHGPDFWALMDRRLPDWRERRRALKS